MAQHILQVIGTAIYSRLSNDAGVTSIIQNNGIWLGAAVSKTEVSVPYVVFNWMAGGELNDSPKPAFDVQILVDAISDDLGECMSLANAIRTALLEQEPLYSDGYKAYAPITAIDPYMERIMVEGIQFWRIGTIYRFRGIQE